MLTTLHLPTVQWRHPQPAGTCAIMPPREGYAAILPQLAQHRGMCAAHNHRHLAFAECTALQRALPSALGGFEVSAQSRAHPWYARWCYCPVVPRPGATAAGFCSFRCGTSRLRATVFHMWPWLATYMQQPDLYAAIDGTLPAWLSPSSIHRVKTPRTCCRP